ncbi:hypothetical protein PTUN_a1574 [Pseudoalteromonas tunicata]|uniref:Uncharacterized protein n=1 Tax=Pseudoalteromonas tunicata D2 TaxID=87626 RepID=A4CB89_9GAMM|nr:hypothetical protein PTUN_a1574 [Pseudoalteromonas tunicata]EAR27626.1 hypothetical protein PTD2_17430 [Pseudoalteromonas tunicata D2]
MLARRVAVNRFNFNISSLPLFGFASAASRESPVQAANKASQATPNNVTPAGSVIPLKGVGIEIVCG